MNTFVEVLDKSASKITLGWKPEASVGVLGYNVYVGQVSVPGSLVKVVSNVAPQASNEPGTYKKVVCYVTAVQVQTVLGLPVTSDFSNTILYFAITYIDTASAESSIADSTVVEVPPVGILGKTMKEDPTQNRHIYGFSDELQRWIKIAASSSGGLITASSNFYAPNMTTEYTRDSSGNVLTERVYFSDRTTTGSPAKLIVYEYSGDFVSKSTVTDSTVI
jgi:hypothetical protein